MEPTRSPPAGFCGGDEARTASVRRRPRTTAPDQDTRLAVAFYASSACVRVRSPVACCSAPRGCRFIALRAFCFGEAMVVRA
ncbi:hypothetical protein PR202_gb22379 [Eleusine coracana subsp. coracana]|uniref:Uncharacterized protein n=1 Tax=Eleusine coracana subsp. coracana TaxID=191504 RepID=A0AAV5FG49_ELECO|nr:hypothetical protein PR202_gb22379 [Eleusine coracana subsp. coracana]